ncbi:MAG: metallophosphoesterase [Pseudorhizobium pelagicum]|uniref:metallophosphoesterase n=1 Tax=Pseudorhizobium pelagicum TaxID=1509405 RepID=UPI00345F4283
MKAWIISDLHVHSTRLPDDFVIPEADVCLCAGDVSGIIEMSLDFLSRHIAPRMPVVMVLGNHDYYGTTIAEALKVAKHGSNDAIRILENETLVLGEVRIIGATLWTDFEIEYGVEGSELPLPERKAHAVGVCKRYMTDFHAIFRSDWHDQGMPGLLTAKELTDRHTESREFIITELAKSFDGRTVVLSHHAPLPRSLHPRFKGHPSNAAFASNLSGIVHWGRPDLWIHGHVHHFLHYREGETWVLCNPHGYRHERPHTGFIPGLVIDI